MGKRRRAREIALQFLYQIDLHAERDPSALEGDVWAQHPGADAATREHVHALVYGTMANRTKIDDLITRFTEHWDLERMAVVDRNILRLAVFELGFADDVPAKVTINEAIEIAKKFGTRESSRFINGVLDRIHRELRPAS